MGCSGSTGNIEGRGPKTISRINEALKRHEIDKEANVAYNYNLMLDKKKRHHMEFLNECDDFRFPTLNSLALINMTSFTTEEGRTFSTIFNRCFNAGMKYFYISSGSTATYPDISLFFDSLAEFLPTVREEVFIEGLKLTASQFSTIIENSKNVSSLVFFNCEITIDRTFSLNKEHQFRISHFDLCCSYYPKSSKFIDKDGLEVLSKELGKTTLAQSVKTFHITSYKTKKGDEAGREEEKIIKKNGFTSTKLVCDQDWPRPA